MKTTVLISIFTLFHLSTNHEGVLNFSRLHDQEQISVATYLKDTLPGNTPFFDSLLQTIQLSLNIDEHGSLQGNNLKELKQMLSTTQFVSIAEEHEVAEVNDFSVALFKLLHQEYNYDHIALEQGPILCDQLNQQIEKKILNPAKKYASVYKRAFHFSGDEELRFIDHSALLAPGKNLLWGCNQEFGAEHVLDLLHPLADENSKKIIEKLRIHAHATEKNRKDNVPYMALKKKPEEFFKINTLSYKNRQLAKPLIDALMISEELYGYLRTIDPSNPTNYENNLKREEYLKEKFFDNYIQASRKKNLPKVLLKFGHWHIQNGLGPSGIPTLGSLVSDVAFMNGKTNLSIGIFLNNKPGSFRGYKEGSLRELFCNRLTDKKYILVKTAPLRKFYYSSKLKKEIPDSLKKDFEELIYQYDLLLFIKDAKSVTWHTVYQN